MDKPFWKRLALVYSPLIAFTLFVIALGGPKPAAQALKGTLDYLMVGTPWKAPDWITAERLFPVRAVLIAYAIVATIWALFGSARTPQDQGKRLSKPPNPSSPEASKTTSEYVRLSMLISPNSLQSPEMRLETAHAEFYKLIDQADAGDVTAEQLVPIVAEWFQDAAKRYFASSPAYFRIERAITTQLERVRDPHSYLLPKVTDEIERGLWLLDFNPSNPRGKKVITFLPTGRIGQGRNQNETWWSFDGEDLVIHREDRSLQNRFRYDGATMRFVCLNAPDAQGIQNQTIQRVRPVPER